MLEGKHPHTQLAGHTTDSKTFDFSSDPLCLSPTHGRLVRSRGHQNIVLSATAFEEYHNPSKS